MAKPSAPTRTRKMLTPIEIGRVAYSAGFGRKEGCPPAHLVSAIAKALAESGGVVNRIGGPNANGTFDYGLWQVNEEHATTGPWYFDREKLLTDPQYNANAAYAIHREAEGREQGFDDIWFADETEEQRKDAATAADIIFGGSGSGGAGGLSDEAGKDVGGNWATDLDSFLANLIPNLGAGLLRTGLGIAGGILIILAIMFIAKQWIVPTVGKAVNAVT